jgi:hypothetical protein
MGLHPGDVGDQYEPGTQVELHVVVDGRRQSIAGAYQYHLWWNFLNIIIIIFYYNY